MNKKSNSIATILMLTVIITTMGVYFSMNKFLDSATTLNKITLSQSEFDLMVRGIIFYSVDDYLKKGFSQNSYEWFENGPYPPNKDNFLIIFNQSFHSNLNKYLNIYNIGSINKFVLEDINIKYNFSMDENRLLVDILNFSIKVDENKYYLKKDYGKLSYNFSSLVYMYKTFYNWNNIEGVEMFNKIVNSFNATGTGFCECGISGNNALPSLDEIGNTSFNKTYILSLIKENLDKLNVDYFDNQTFRCNYKIVSDNIFEFRSSIIRRLDSNGRDCSDIDLNSYGGDIANIWGDERKTVIDLSTISYSDTPRFRYLGPTRSLSVPEESLVLDRESITGSLDDSFVSNENDGDLVVGIVKKSPFVAFSVDITCSDLTNTYFDGIELKPLDAKFGFRINILKDSTGGLSTDGLYDSVNEDCSGRCKSTNSCSTSCTFLDEFLKSKDLSDCGEGGCDSSDKLETKVFGVCENGEETDETSRTTTNCVYKDSCNIIHNSYRYSCDNNQRIITRTEDNTGEKSEIDCSRVYDFLDNIDIIHSDIYCHGTNSICCDANFVCGDYEIRLVYSSSACAGNQAQNEVIATCSQADTSECNNYYRCNFGNNNAGNQNSQPQEEPEEETDGQNDQTVDID